MADFDSAHRNLDKFLAGFEKRKEGKNSGGKNEVQELDSGREQFEIQEEKVPSKRISQTVRTPALVKLSTASK